VALDQVQDSLRSNSETARATTDRLRLRVMPLAELLTALRHVGDDRDTLGRRELRVFNRAINAWIQSES
jgi:hypothetical protein